MIIRRKKLLLFYGSTIEKAQLHNSLHNVIDYYTKKNFLVTVSPVISRDSVYSTIINRNEEYDLIVCAGGIDTLNKTLSAILNTKTDAVIEYVASGPMIMSGKYIRIAPCISSVLAAAVNEQIYTLNVGAFNSCYLIYAAAFGALAQTIHNIPSKSRNLLGDIIFTLKKVKAISELKSYSLTMHYDDNCIQGEFIFGIIINSFFSADIAEQILQGKDSRKGMFDILLIKTPHNLAELSSAISSLAANKINSETMIYIQASRIHIQSDPAEWLIDGESIGIQEKIILRNHQQKIKMLIRQRKDI